MYLNILYIYISIELFIFERFYVKISIIKAFNKCLNKYQVPRSAWKFAQVWNDAPESLDRAFRRNIPTGSIEANLYTFI